MPQRLLCTAPTAGPDWSRWPARILPGGPVPAELLARAGVTRVADLTGLDDIGIPVRAVVRPAAMTVANTLGVGATGAAAERAAGMQALCNWHAENVAVSLAGRSATDLAGELTYDPATLRRPPNSVYDPASRLDWVLGTTLVSGAHTWMPRAAVALDLGLAGRWDPPMFSRTDVGLAAECTYQAAALTGLYELMQWHCLAVARAHPTAWEVPSDGLAGASCEPMVAAISAGSDCELRVARIEVWDGYFCFRAELLSPSGGVPFRGVALHHDPNQALAQAIGKAVRRRLSMISGAVDQLESALSDPFGGLSRYAAPDYPMCADRHPTPLPWTAGFGAGTDALRAQLVAAASAVRDRAGAEPIAAVCDFAGACVPVVRVLAPGLPLPTRAGARVPLQDLR